MSSPRVRSLLLLHVALLLGVWCSAAEATIIITSGSGGGNPDENLLFTGSGVVNGPAPTVVGRTNQTGTLVNVFSGSSSINLNLIGSGGQARVTGDFDASTPQPNDRLPFGSSGVQLFLADPNLLFTDLKFDVFAVANGTLEIAVEGVDIGPDTPFSPIVQTFNISKNGSNFFRVRDDGLSPLQGIAKVTLTTFAGATATDLIDPMKHIRVGGIRSRDDGDDDDDDDDQQIEQIPEPAAFAVWLLAGGLGAALTWRRVRSSVRPAAANPQSPAPPGR